MKEAWRGSLSGIGITLFGIGAYLMGGYVEAMAAVGLSLVILATAP